MKIHQIDKTGKRTGVTQEVPLKMWEKLQSQWGNKLRWQYDPPKPIKKKGGNSRTSDGDSYRSD